MNIETYLNRIGYSLPLRADRATLEGLIKAQLSTIPFENLDQQMGVSVSTTLSHAYDKIVLRHRGGWCFELNGLFHWLLSEIGFDVSVLAGHVGVDRPEPGSDSDHMLLMVNCDGPLLVDVGFGGGPNAPIALQPVTVSQPPYSISIYQHDGGFYKYSEIANGNEGAYWFTLDKVETGHFEASNRKLQSDSRSPFRRTLTAQRRLANNHIVLRGLVKKTIGKTNTDTIHLLDEQALAACLRSDFGLEVPEILNCWSALKHRHGEIFGMPR